MYNNHFRKRGGRPPIFPLIFVAMLLLLSAVVMLLWNAILPPLLGVNNITYLQSIGLLILCRILFGGFRFGPPGRPPFNGGNQWRNKLTSMSDEEKAKFRNEWQKRCGRRGESPASEDEQKGESL